MSTSQESGTRVSSADLAQAIHAVQHGERAVEIVYKSHERWPLPAGDEPHDSVIRVAVLDSSFNPPTLAHLALAGSSPPATSPEDVLRLLDGEEDDSRSADAVIAHPDVSNPADYDARLLLLSVRNADKTLKPGDASYVQRLEMMILLARQLEGFGDEEGSNSASTDSLRISRNVAVTIIDEPTFVKKSSVLRQFLSDRLASISSSRNSLSAPSGSQATVAQVELTFLMGIDTLVRFLAPRYYGDHNTMRSAMTRFAARMPEGDDSKIVCAWRGTGKEESLSLLRRSSSDAGEEDPNVTQRDDQQLVAELARSFIRGGSLSFLDLTESEMILSSSEVRSAKGRGDESWRDMVPRLIRDYVERETLYVQ